MASLKLNGSFDFSSDADIAWVLSQFAQNRLTYVSGTLTQTVSGNFSVDARGVASGIVTDITYRSGNTDLYTLSGLAADAARVQQFMATVGDLQQTYDYLFSGNDTIKGYASSQGVLRGFGGDDTFSSIGLARQVDGGTGADTVLLSDTFGATEQRYSALTGQLEISSDQYGKHIFTGVETFVFSDKTMTLDQLIARVGGSADKFSADIATSGHLQVGAALYARIEQSGDTDWMAVNLVAGNTYTFSASQDGYLGLIDPFLSLRDSAGALLASDDDSGLGREALLTYSPSFTGTYIVAASSGAYGTAHAATAGDIGTYVLTATSSTLGSPGSVFVRSTPIEPVTASASGVIANKSTEDNMSTGTVMSADGRYIVFLSQATNLAPGSTNFPNNVFYKDMQTGAVQVVFAPLYSAQRAWDGATVSADGRYVAFGAYEGQVKAGGNTTNWSVFVKDMQSGAITLAGSKLSGEQAQLSADGHYLLYSTNDATLVPGEVAGVPNLVRKDLQTGELALVVKTAGGQAYASSGGDMSPDGRFITFTSSAPLFGPHAANYGDAYRKDMLTGELIRVLPANPDPGGSGSGADLVGDGGRYTVYSTGGISPRDYFFKDMSTGEAQEIGRSANGVGAVDEIRVRSMSDDGRFILFSSGSSFVPGDAAHANFKAYVRDTYSGAIAKVDLNDGLSSGAVFGESMSADGSYILLSRYVPLGAQGNGNEYYRVSNPFLDVSTPASYTMDARELTLTLTGAAPVAGIGNAKANHLTGNGAANLLSGAGGDDVIDGGAGIDTALYSGSRAAYTIAAQAQGRSVTDTTGKDGHDTLLNVERLQFADSAVAYDIDGAAGKAYRVYQAAFDRIPDQGGLGFWLHYMDQGMTLNQVAAGFMASPEFTSLYGAAPSDTDFVTRLYGNVLHRAPEPQGFDFWMNAMHNGTTRAEVLAFFSESPENQAQVIGAITNGIIYTPFL